MYAWRVRPFFILAISLTLVVLPQRGAPFFSYFSPSAFTLPLQSDRHDNLIPVKRFGAGRPILPDDPSELVSIAQLLADPNRYHKKVIKVRGTVTQPELHVSESGLFIRFVFVLRDGEHPLIVFGHHDRTQGNIQIEMGETVEVLGIFWKERTANDHQFQNNLEAMTVTKYPLLHPDSA